MTGGREAHRILLLVPNPVIGAKLRIKKNLAKAGAVAGLAVGLALAVAPAASAAAAGMTVTPSTGLTNGASVSVSVTGFGANETVFIGQCAYVGGEPACPSGTKRVKYG